MHALRWMLWVHYLRFILWGPSFSLLTFTQICSQTSLRCPWVTWSMKPMCFLMRPPIEAKECFQRWKDLGPIWSIYVQCQPWKLKMFLQIHHFLSSNLSLTCQERVNTKAKLNNHTWWCIGSIFIKVTPHLNIVLDKGFAFRENYFLLVCRYNLQILTLWEKKN